MSRYRRPKIEGGIFFFTVVLADRSSELLVKHIERSSSQIQRRETGLWQRRFWEHAIRDDADFERHVDYIHFNAVKHGYVIRACDWPHSSLHRYVKNAVLPPDWSGDLAEIEGRFGE